ncbi:hypothetical protein ACFL2J_04885 [Candidatus Omnitrophota bacterium]
MRYVFAAVICMIMTSCAATASRQHRSGINAVLNEQFSLYEKENKEEFFNSISKDYYPDYNEFYYLVEDFLHRQDNIWVDFNIEKVLESGNANSVDIEWYKTYVDRRGQVQKRSGFSTFIFDTSKRKPKLINVKGDNPFTQ